ncbi:MAG: hypothetical protein C0511_16770 [Hyphomicrobium sp.]|nr:hypothetical protein [Hyphomicrobium sp.]
MNDARMVLGNRSATPRGWHWATESPPRADGTGHPKRHPEFINSRQPAKLHPGSDPGELGRWRASRFLDRLRTEGVVPL